MRCLICNQAETVPGFTSLRFERGELALTMNSVPVRLCPHCGEAYADETVTVNLLRQAEQLADAGLKVAVCEYGINP
jgi:YgiT-type zinc finger domain-containing protein